MKLSTFLPGLFALLLTVMAVQVQVPYKFDCQSLIDQAAQPDFNQAAAIDEAIHNGLTVHDIVDSCSTITPPASLDFAAQGTCPKGECDACYFQCLSVTWLPSAWATCMGVCSGTKCKGCKPGGSQAALLQLPGYNQTAVDEAVQQGLTAEDIVDQYSNITARPSSELAAQDCEELACFLCVDACFLLIEFPPAAAACIAVCGTVVCCWN